MQGLNENLLQKFGEHVRVLREERGFSSAEMARLCLMDRGNYTRIESGKTNPTLITISILCQALEITYKELFDGFDVMHNML